MAWYLVIEISHRWRSFSSFLREVSAVLRLLALLAESDREWTLALLAVRVHVHKYYSIKQGQWQIQNSVKRVSQACWYTAHWVIFAVKNFSWLSVTVKINRTEFLSMMKYSTKITVC